MPLVSMVSSPSMLCWLMPPSVLMPVLLAAAVELVSTRARPPELRFAPTDTPTAAVVAVVSATMTPRFATTSLAPPVSMPTARPLAVEFTSALATPSMATAAPTA